jgi:hypothetical protein
MEATAIRIGQLMLRNFSVGRPRSLSGSTAVARGNSRSPRIAFLGNPNPLNLPQLVFTSLLHLFAAMEYEIH